MKNMEKSNLFTKAELEELQRRKNKDFSDKTGIYSLRIKPKLTELLNYWFPRKKELEKLIESKRKK